MEQQQISLPSSLDKKDSSCAEHSAHEKVANWEWASSPPRTFTSFNDLNYNLRGWRPCQPEATAAAPPSLARTASNLCYAHIKLMQQKAHIELMLLATAVKGQHGGPLRTLQLSSSSFFSRSIGKHVLVASGSAVTTEKRCQTFAIQVIWNSQTIENLKKKNF